MLDTLSLSDLYVSFTVDPSPLPVIDADAVNPVERHPGWSNRRIDLGSPYEYVQSNPMRKISDDSTSKISSRGCHRLR